MLYWHEETITWRCNPADFCLSHLTRAPAHPANLLLQAAAGAGQGQDVPHSAARQHVDERVGVQGEERGRGHCLERGPGVPAGGQQPQRLNRRGRRRLRRGQAQQARPSCTSPRCPAPDLRWMPGPGGRRALEQAGQAFEQRRRLWTLLRSSTDREMTCSLRTKHRNSQFTRREPRAVLLPSRTPSSAGGDALRSRLRTDCPASTCTT